MNPELLLPALLALAVAAPSILQDADDAPAAVRVSVVRVDNRYSLTLGDSSEEGCRAPWATGDSVEVSWTRGTAAGPTELSATLSLTPASAVCAGTEATASNADAVRDGGGPYSLRSGSSSHLPD